MNIAHISNTGGAATDIAKEQEQQGHKTKIFVFNQLLQEQFGGTLIGYNPVAHRGSRYAPLLQRYKINPLWFIEREKFWNELKDFDIWHHHGPYGRLKRHIKKRIAGKVYIKNYRGSDLRGKFDDDFCLVSTPDLLEFAPNGYWSPNPVSLDLISKFYKNPMNTIPKVAHYPHYKLYGRDLYPDVYSKVLKQLESEKKIQVVEIFKQPYAKTLEMIADCDIVIGKILHNVGWFGRFELEAMALGKPVICYVKNDLYEKYRPAIYNTTKDTFYDDLKNLIKDEDTRQRLAKEGPEQIKQVYDVKIVCKDLDKYYKMANEVTGMRIDP